MLAFSGLATLISAVDTKAPAAVNDIADAADNDFTIFNGEKVPKMKDIGDEEFDNLISKGYTVAKFYSPSCIHCTAIAPVWQTLYEYYWTSKPVPHAKEAAQETLNDFHHYYTMDFASVNCIAYGDTCEKYGVGAYPTFIMFKDGKEIDKMHGARDQKGLGDFMEKTLETIRPGSRVKGGPKYPETGATALADVKVAKATDAAKVGTAPVSSPAAARADASVADVKAPVAASKAVDLTKPKKAVNPNPIGNSVNLDAESFNHLVTYSQEPWFVKFYAPWCQHCQMLAPVWSQMGKEMQGKLNVGEVNCEIEKRLCKDIGIQSYPTMMFFRGGERVEYDGLRGLGDLVSYCKSAIDNEEGVIDVTLDEFEELEKKHEVIFVYFYDMATTSEDFIALERLTLSLIGHAKLVKTQDPAMFERYKITTWPRLIVSREGRPTYYAPITPNEMRDYRQILYWMQSVWLPIVPELLPSNARQIMDGKIVVLGILTRERPDEFMVARNELKSAANEWMDKQITMFQIERQEFRDAKQLRIEEAEARKDERALRAAKSIRIDMNRTERKEVAFAWVDGVFWERWIRTTFGIQVADGERVIINDEDQKRYWDTTITGNYIIPSRTSILETIPKVVANPPKIKPKLTISSFSKVFFDIKGAASEHSFLTMLFFVGIIGGVLITMRKKKRSRGFFNLDSEKNLGLLGGSAPKAD